MISVIIPIYNVEKYLKRCVDSVLNQTYKDIEIILVNDGSTDSSKEICNSYKESFIKVIHKTNEGLGYARNSGLELAKGEFVTFLDADDYWHKDLLKEMMYYINKYSADTCFGGYTRVSNNEDIITSVNPEFEIYDTNAKVRNQFFPRLLGSLPNKQDSIRPSVWNVLYKLSIIKDNQIKFPSERQLIAEDIIFDLEYYLYAQNVILVPVSGYYYRVTPGSLTQKYKEDRFEKVILLYTYIFRALDNENYNSMCSLRASRQFFVYVRTCIHHESKYISGNNYITSISNIKKICSNNFLIRCINEYPVSKLNVKQKVFIYLLKYKFTFALYLIICNKKFKKQYQA